MGTQTIETERKQKKRCCKAVFSNFLVLETPLEPSKIIENPKDHCLQMINDIYQYLLY